MRVSNTHRVCLHAGGRAVHLAREGRFSAREGEDGVEVEEERFSLREGEVGVGVEAASARAALRSAEFSFLLSSYRVSQREPM